jgi:hypothetical protein
MVESFNFVNGQGDNIGTKRFFNAVLDVLGLRLGIVTGTGA